MTEHLLSTVAGRTWATDTLCVFGVIGVCVLVGCALGLPLLRLALVPVIRIWRRMTPFARIAILPVIALVANFAVSKQGTNDPLRSGNGELRMENGERAVIPSAWCLVPDAWCLVPDALTKNLLFPQSFFQNFSHNHLQLSS